MAKQRVCSRRCWVERLYRNLDVGEADTNAVSVVQGVVVEGLVPPHDELALSPSEARLFCVPVL